jgi:hypothetical protein
LGVQPVIVPKKNTDVQRVGVDYTSLNKHCPKDPFPLPRIDQIIESTVGCVRLSFLDAYSGYNQIKLKKEDKEKQLLSQHTAFSAIKSCPSDSKTQEQLINE